MASLEGQEERPISESLSNMVYSLLTTPFQRVKHLVKVLSIIAVLYHSHRTHCI